MKRFYQIFSSLTLLLAVAVFTTSCGDPQEEARRSLEKNHYRFQVEDLLIAAGANDLPAIDLFVEGGMEVDTADEAGNTALIQAAASGRKESVEKLLGLGADPRHTNKYGRDALISSAAKGFEEVSRILLSRGADPELKDQEGWNALSIAAYNGHKETVALLSGSASQEGLDNALLLASFTGNPDVIQHLLTMGSYINTRSPESQTPLMIASEHGHEEAVRILLQNQANPYATDEENRTAAVIAEAEGHTKVKDLILNPDLWGESEESMIISSEMKGALSALAQGGAEETLGAYETADHLEEPLVAKPVAKAENKQKPAAEKPGGETPVAKTNQGQMAEKTAPQGEVAPETRQLSQPTNNKGHISVPGSTLASAPTKKPKPAPAMAKKSSSPVSRKVVRERPMVALNGSMIRTRNPQQAAVESFVLSSYRERPLPIVVKDVDSDTAQIRMLDSHAPIPVEVHRGDQIPGTNFRVVDMQRKFVSSKEGKGRMVDVSRVQVEDTQTGSTHLLVKNVKGQSSDSFAILAAPGSDYQYVVKTGDVFRTEQPGLGVKDFQVLDIRPTGVVIKDLTTEQVLTVGRNGVINP